MKSRQTVIWAILPEYLRKSVQELYSKTVGYTNHDKSKQLTQFMFQLMHMFEVVFGKDNLTRPAEESPTLSGPMRALVDWLQEIFRVDKNPNIEGQMVWLVQNGDITLAEYIHQSNGIVRVRLNGEYLDVPYADIRWEEPDLAQRLDVAGYTPRSVYFFTEEGTIMCGDAVLPAVNGDVVMVDNYARIVPTERIIHRWRANHGEDYFCMTAEGKILKAIEGGTEDDTNRWLFDNYFSTFEQCEKAVLKFRTRNSAVKQ